MAITNNTTWDIAHSNGVMLSSDGLTAAYSGSVSNKIRATVGRTTGKHYFELNITNGSAAFFGIAGSNVFMNSSAMIFFNNDIRGYYPYGSERYPEETSYGSTATLIGQIISVLLDLDNNTLEFWRNGVSQGVSHTNLASLPRPVYAFISSGNAGSNVVSANFGATPFVHNMPSGYKPYNGNEFILFSSASNEIKSLTKGKIDSISKIPIMTSNTLPSGIASASKIESNTYNAWKAFDGTDTSGSYWSSGANDFPMYLSYEFENVVRIGRYALITHNGTFSPKSWTFEGSNDGVNWTILDTQSTPLVANVLTNFTLSNTGLFKKYRLHISSNNGAASTYISGFKMYEAESNSIINLASASEENFINYGMTLPIEASTYSKVTDIISNSTTLGSGKLYKKAIDTNIISIKKIKIL